MATSAWHKRKSLVKIGEVTPPKEQVVYVRNPDYIPRDETPSGSTGGKKVYLDKVIWRYIPDPWDAAEDLAAGKVDWWEQPPLDFIPKIEQNPDLQTFVIDPLETQGWRKPNFLHPPFNNKKAREALLHMMDQVTYLALAIGQSQYYHPCYSIFACGGPYATTIGAEPIMEPPPPIEPLPRRPVYGPFSSEASNTALALLKRWLSPEQRRELEKRGSFDVVGCHTGRRYRINPGKLNNVRILQDNVEVAALCFAPSDAGFLPEADIMLAQKIALKTNEKAALKVAHQSSPLSLFPAERMRLHLELRTRR